MSKLHIYTPGTDQTKTEESNHDFSSTMSYSEKEIEATEAVENHQVYNELSEAQSVTSTCSITKESSINYKDLKVYIPQAFELLNRPKCPRAPRATDSKSHYELAESFVNKLKAERLNQREIQL